MLVPYVYNLAKMCAYLTMLTHWGQVMYLCVGKLTTIGSDNGLSPGRRQAIIWTSAGILLIGPLGTNCSEILIGIQTLSFKKIHLKMLSAKWRLHYYSLLEIRLWVISIHLYLICIFVVKGSRPSKNSKVSGKRDKWDFPLRLEWGDISARRKND